MPPPAGNGGAGGGLGTLELSGAGGGLGTLELSGGGGGATFILGDRGVDELSVAGGDMLDDRLKACLPPDLKPCGRVIDVKVELPADRNDLSESTSGGGGGRGGDSGFSCK